MAGGAHPLDGPREDVELRMFRDERPADGRPVDEASEQPPEGREEEEEQRQGHAHRDHQHLAQEAHLPRPCHRVDCRRDGRGRLVRTGGDEPQRDQRGAHHADQQRRERGEDEHLSSAKAVGGCRRPVSLDSPGRVTSSGFDHACRIRPADACSGFARPGDMQRAKASGQRQQGRGGRAKTGGQRRRQRQAGRGGGSDIIERPAGGARTSSGT